MDNNLKNALIGLGIAVATGAAIYFLTDEDFQEGAKATVNRRRAKRFVRNTLGGSDRALNAIDAMDDEDINNLLDTADRVEDIQDQLGDFGYDVKDRAVDIKDQVFNYAKDLIN